jgi:hypothetical protein
VSKRKTKLEVGESDFLDGLGVGEAKVDHYKKVVYKGKAEHDTKAELTAAQQVFRTARKRETEQRQEMMDVAFYFCVVFETEKQKAEFLRKLKVSTDMDEGTMVMSGFALAKRLNIKLESPRVKWSVARNDQSWAEELGTLGEMK